MKKVYRIIETTGEWEDEYSRTVACYFSEYRANNHLDELKDTYNNADQIRAKKCKRCPLINCSHTDFDCSYIECGSDECCDMLEKSTKEYCESYDVVDNKCKNYAISHQDYVKYSMEILEVVE